MKNYLSTQRVELPGTRSVWLIQLMLDIKARTLSPEEDRGK